MSPRARALLIYAGVLGVVFLATFAAGFVYQHEPEQDQLVLSVDRQSGPASTEVLVGGSVVEFDGSRLTLRADDGSVVTIDVPPDTPVEALERLEGEALAAGTRVNIGAEQTQFGLVLTGVVSFEASP